MFTKTLEKQGEVRCSRGQIRALSTGRAGQQGCPRPDPKASMMLRLQWKHHRRERVAGQPKKRKSHAAPGFTRWRTGVTQAVRGFCGYGWRGFVPGGSRLARSLAVLCLLASSAGCILTGDLPDPALDVPQGYKSARSTAAVGAPPTLDWWRGFRSAELATLMKEGRRAGAHRRRCPAAESLRGRLGSLFAHLGLERERPVHRWARGRELYGFDERQLSARLLGTEP